MCSVERELKSWLRIPNQGILCAFVLCVCFVMCRQGSFKIRNNCVQIRFITWKEERTNGITASFDKLEDWTYCFFIAAKCLKTKLLCMIVAMITEFTNV